METKMKSPFPGMDPYLEDSEVWRGFHHGLAEGIRAQLNQQLSARYFADVEVHTVLEEVTIGTSHHMYADTAVLESEPYLTGGGTAVVIAPAPIQREALVEEPHKLRSVQVKRTDTNQLVTTIEILSPFNKRGEGIYQYQDKRWRILRSDIHLVELDLLRSGQRPGMEVQQPPLDCDYVVLVSRARLEDDYIRKSDIWPVALNEALPVCPVPLLPPDPDVALDLNEVLAGVYARGVYGRRLDYSRPLPPPACDAGLVGKFPAAIVMGNFDNSTPLV
jgi:hypothetical protein